MPSIVAIRMDFDAVVGEPRFAQMQHAVRFLSGNFRMRDEQCRGGVIASSLVDQREDARCGIGIEITRRLIEQ